MKQSHGSCACALIPVLCTLYLGGMQDVCVHVRSVLTAVGGCMYLCVYECVCVHTQRYIPRELCDQSVLP